MALHADLHLTFKAQPRGIDDALTRLLRGDTCILNRPQVSLAGSMTALAVDPFRHFSFEPDITGDPQGRSCGRTCTQV